jgi:hypothetical protein
VRAVIFYSIFQEKLSGVDFQFLTVETTTYLMTCVSFSLLIQWYELFWLLKASVQEIEAKNPRYFANLWLYMFFSCSAVYVVDMALILDKIFNSASRVRLVLARVMIGGIQSCFILTIVTGFIVLWLRFNKLIKENGQY